MKSRRLLAALALVIALAAIIAVWILRAQQVQFAEAQAESARVREQAARSMELVPAEVAESPDTIKDSRSFVPPPAAEVAAGRLDLLVASTDGAPVPAALLVLFRGEEVIASDTTNSDGLARFPSGEGAAEVAVFAPSWPVTRAAIDLGPGRQTVTLPAGAILGGWVLVDGATPTESIELQFRTAVPSKILASLPKSVTALLMPALTKHGTQFAITDAKGAFGFRGLPADSSGQLSWDGPYVLDRTKEGDDVNDFTSLSVATLRSDLELRLATGLELRLRVVDPTGAPVPEAGVEVMNLKRRGEFGWMTSSIRGATDDEGRYRDAIGRKPPVQVQVRITRPDGAALTIHEFGSPPELRGAPRPRAEVVTHELPNLAELHGVWDVGDLALAAIRTIEVHVQESSNAPIVGAQGAPLPLRSISKVRSDAQGNFELAIGDDARQVLVQALGYENAIVDVTADTTEIIATLLKACLLEFSIPDGDEVDRRFLLVKVIGDPPILVDDNQKTLPLMQVGYSNGRDRDDRGTSWYMTSQDKDGRWKIAGLIPGIALKAELTARTGQVLAHADVAPLEEGEHRRIELVLNRKPKSLRVHVLDPDQNPVPSAEVSQEDPFRGSNNRATVDVTGTHVIASIYAGRFRLRVDANDFPTKYLYGVTVQPDEITVVLDRPRSLEIELVRPDGSPVDGKVSIEVAMNPASGGSAKNVAPGRWVLNNLPPGEVEIRVWGDFGGFTRMHDMSVPFRRFVVGEKGKVNATVTIPEELQESEWSLAIYPEGSSRLEAREELEGFFGMAFGTYDIWLETRAPEPPWSWTRVGAPARVVLDEEHPTVEIEMHP